MRIYGTSVGGTPAGAVTLLTGFFGLCPPCHGGAAVEDAGGARMAEALTSDLVGRAAVGDAGAIEALQLVAQTDIHRFGIAPAATRAMPKRRCRKR